MVPHPGVGVMREVQHFYLGLRMDDVARFVPVNQTTHIHIYLSMYVSVLFHNHVNTTSKTVLMSKNRVFQFSLLIINLGHSHKADARLFTFMFAVSHQEWIQCLRLTMQVKGTL